ncbi:type IV pilus twitching motility protein PilT [Herbaspirillum autotrophicum]|uniref:type IV pilus twitching motility protein PilT n=1 Tax=Herbaspirillum autotrophicum TaxID=180195 RepID=UPI00067E5111|nr:type IV pilus twitching motility protein PilT [Herbaspirillum autotrophicum]
MDISELLAFSVKNRASDLHLSAGLPPMLRVDGAIRRIKMPPLQENDVCSMINGLLTNTQRQCFTAMQEFDFSFAMAELARFRINVFRHERGTAAVIRTIPSRIPSLEQLLCPPIFAELALRQRGLILVTGPTGCGKSTTLAAMINHINEQHCAHILTIEDPLEFVHESKKCLINQREVPAHTPSFGHALRAALREDPDVILVGELRDLETIRLALTAAETGHLVLGTLHTSCAAQSIDRIIDVFPREEKDMVRTMLSESLAAVTSQVLLKRKDSDGRIAAHEIMLGTHAIRNLIREGKVAQMYSTMQTSAQLGMQTLDQHLAELLQRGLIDAGSARAAAKMPEHFPADAAL